MKRKRNSLKGAIIFLIIIGILFGGFYIYTLDYYKADVTAIEELDTPTVRIESDDQLTFFYPDESSDLNTAFIFYPGGKVESTAYSPLLVRLAQKGITCILVKMPFNLAVFNINAADKIFQDLPEIRNWYIGGHSLGGAMASSYASENSESMKGLILLAAYPVEDISMPVLAVYGSNDGVLDIVKLQNIKSIVKIEGGNHAYFGNYGEQDGDGTATITREEQQEETVTAIIDFVDSNQ
ncbi:MAG: alpha/beta fold hydrolase [Herbinix sp.]|jgi:hypothetical protein|nr:alpha/beta fold hydrolase [Herbinix sp.]